MKSKCARAGCGLVYRQFVLHLLFTSQRYLKALISFGRFFQQELSVELSVNRNNDSFRVLLSCIRCHCVVVRPGLAVAFRNWKKAISAAERFSFGISVRRAVTSRVPLKHA